MLVDTRARTATLQTFMRPESGLRKNGQFRLKPADTYLFIKISDNTIFNFFYSFSLLPYFVQGA